jgi:hypothetical protein
VGTRLTRRYLACGSGYVCRLTTASVSAANPSASGHGFRKLEGPGCRKYMLRTVDERIFFNIALFCNYFKIRICLKLITEVGHPSIWRTRQELIPSGRRDTLISRQGPHADRTCRAGRTRLDRKRPRRPPGPAIAAGGFE